MNGYTEEADRYQRLIDKSKFRNDQIRNQISQLAFNVPDDLEERLDALAKEREEIECQQEKKIPIFYGSKRIATKLTHPIRRRYQELQTDGIIGRKGLLRSKQQEGIS